MTNKCRVEEHLRNSALYAVAALPLDEAWKHRLLARYTPSKQLAMVLSDRPSPWIPVVAVAFPLLCAVVLTTAVLGQAEPLLWLDNAYWTLSAKIPPIGLKEILLFCVCVASTTLMLRTRMN